MNLDLVQFCHQNKFSVRFAMKLNAQDFFYHFSSFLPFDFYFVSVCC